MAIYESRQGTVYATTIAPFTLLEFTPKALELVVR
jgi:hypothetical protein